MKASYNFELEAVETEIVKSITGQDITTMRMDSEVPVEFAQLGKLLLEALPLAKSIFAKAKVDAPRMYVNGVEVTPPAPTPEEEASEDKAAPDPEEFLEVAEDGWYVDEEGWCIHRSA